MNTVRIYDMKTGQSRQIPARELAPGYVKVTFAEDGEEAFVLEADLPPPPRYQELELRASVGGAFRALTHGKSWSREERRDLYNIILSCLTNGPHALECLELKALSRAQAVEIRDRLESEVAQ